MTPCGSTHQADLAAPAERGYGLAAGVTRWPVLVPPCLAVRLLPGERGTQRVRLWALVDDEVLTWTAVRELDERRLCVTLREDAPTPPVTWLHGSWRCTPVPGTAGRSRLVLEHRWAVAGDPHTRDRTAAALDRYAQAEVAAVKMWAERAEQADELTFAFSDWTLVRGEPSEVYRFLLRADLWPERLDHVTHVDLRTDPEPRAGAEVQYVAMGTRDDAGATHLTRSVRLCLSDGRILYKQTVPPPGLLAHTGEWVVTPAGEGCLVIAWHRVALDPAGWTAGRAEARRVVRERLGADSRRTLEDARLFVEGGLQRAGSR